MASGPAHTDENLKGLAGTDNLRRNQSHRNVVYDIHTTLLVRLRHQL
jgi:hypothetical protein